MSKRSINMDNEYLLTAFHNFALRVVIFSINETGFTSDYI
jgi:hypothetical protein